MFCQFLLNCSDYSDSVRSLSADTAMIRVNCLRHVRLIPAIWEMMRKGSKCANRIIRWLNELIIPSQSTGTHDQRCWRIDIQWFPCNICNPYGRMSSGLTNLDSGWVLFPCYTWHLITNIEAREKSSNSDCTLYVFTISFLCNGIRYCGCGFSIAHYITHSVLSNRLNY